MSMFSTSAAPTRTGSVDWRQRLARSGTEGFRFIHQFALQRRRFIREYVGTNYGGLVPDAIGDTGGSSARRRPFNVLNQGVNVLVPNLVARNPTVVVKPRKQPLKGTATILGRLCEYANDIEDHANTLRWQALDAIFTAGISYTCLEPSGFGIMHGTEFRDLGKLVTDTIDIEDFGVDPTAKHWRQKAWAAHTLRISREEALEKGLYPPEFIEACIRYEEPTGSASGAEDMLKGGVNRDDANQFTDYVYVTQYYLERERVFVTMPGVRDNEDFDYEHAIEREYFGVHDDGPYDLFGLAFAPSQLMPVAPIGLWIDMHLAINTIARKIVDQIKVMKSVIAGDLVAEDDLLALDAALHTGIVRAKNIDRIKQFQWGQPNEQSLMIFERFMEYASKNQGNTDLLGGLKSTGGTATEAELVAAGAGVRVTDMQEMTYRHVERVQRKRAFYLFHDPLIQETLTFELSPTVSIQIPVDNELMEGEFLDYNFKIEAQSMQRVDPQVQLRRKLDHLQTIGLALNYEQLSSFRFNADGWIRNSGRHIYGPGEIDEFWRSPEAAMEAATVFGLYAPQGAALQGGPAGPGAPGAGQTRPGLPGRPGMPGRMQTGAGSPNFDRSANTKATVDAM